MNGPLLRHTWRSQRLKLLAVSIGLFLWGFLLPVVYASFGIQFRRVVESGIVPAEFAEFGGGDIFSLSGSITLGFVHPIAIALLAIFAVGFAVGSVAGERQRGTLEVLLSRPVSRRALYRTLLLAVTLFIMVATAAIIAGSLVGSLLWDVLDEIDLVGVPVLWLNAILLFLAFASIGLAASVSFDRVTPALALTVLIVILSYFLQVIGSLWPDAEPLQPYSLFSYLQPKPILDDAAVPVGDMALLAVVALAAILYSLLVFPRRDLAAPS
ncbi:ABC transporter permease subunit [soil metagenome]